MNMRYGPRTERALLVTDRLAGRTNGHAFRVANVIDGLQERFDLHVLLIDVSGRGETQPASEHHKSTTIPSARASRLSRVLAAVGHLPTDIHYRSRAALRNQIQQAVGDQEFDVVWCSRLRTYLLVRGLFNAKFVVDLDDLNDQLLTSVVEERRRRRSGPIAWLENLWDLMDSRRWAAVQRNLHNEVATQVVCKEVDREIAGLSDAVVVPNSYPDPRVQREGQHDQVGTDANDSIFFDQVNNGPKQSIFFAGSLDYRPNRFGIEWFISEVLPLVTAQCPDATLEVVGYVPNEIAANAPANCKFHGPGGNVAPHIENASLVIAPLWSGGGTLLKVLEALAWGRPLVATSCGIRGFDLVDERDVLVADDPVAFADACVRILNDPKLAAQLGANARRFYEVEDGAGACSRAAADVVASVVDRHGSLGKA